MVTDSIRKIVAGCIARKEWRSEALKKVWGYIPKTTSRKDRDAIRAYVQSEYDAAGAGFNGRWQS